MNDRELVEYATKAAGYYGLGSWHEESQSMWDGEGWCFDPLYDEGDRYRLAQRLKISIDFSDCCAWKRLPNGELIQEFWGGECGDEAHAIVRAAAEVGMKMDAQSESAG